MKKESKEYLRENEILCKYIEVHVLHLHERVFILHNLYAINKLPNL